MINKNKNKKGFTLIEILVVIGLIAILSGIVLIAINPSRQFKIARDSERQANISAILNAIGQNMTDHSGVFVCGGVQVALPASKTKISSSDGVNIASCLVPDYLPSMPFDPSKTGSHYTSVSDVDTGYYLSMDPSGRVSVYADGEMGSSTMTVTR